MPQSTHHRQSHQPSRQRPWQLHGAKKSQVTMMVLLDVVVQDEDEDVVVEAVAVAEDVGAAVWP